MKTASCNDLKGACDTAITGETADEMGANSRAHVMKMVESGDQAHLDAVEAMKALSQEEQQNWYADFVASFDTFEDV